MISITTASLNNLKLVTKSSGRMVVRNYNISSQRLHSARTTLLSSVSNSNTTKQSLASSSNPIIKKFSTAPATAVEDTNEETVKFTYVMSEDGTEHEVNAKIGMNLMEVAQENDIELEGACGGELACATCHLVFSQDIYDEHLPEKIDEEDDMLDLAFELTETSRLGCQICAKKEFEGMKVIIPASD